LVGPAQRRHEPLVVARVKHRLVRRCDHRHAGTERGSAAVGVGLVLMLRRGHVGPDEHQHGDPEAHVHRTSYIPFWVMYVLQAAVMSVPEALVADRFMLRYVTQSVAVLPHDGLTPLIG